MTEPAKGKKLYKLATELDLSHEVLIECLRKKGFDVKSHMSSLTPAMIEEVLVYFRKEKESAGKHQRQIQMLRESRKRQTNVSNDYVLMLGNGINNIDNEYTWGSLIKDLISFIGATGQISVENKPFPLLYEQIVVEAVRKRGLTEARIKEYIATEVQKLSVNTIHESVVSLNLGNILTTNYDYTVERALKITPARLVNVGLIRESVYSLFRYSRIGNTNMWHLHGEANSPSTIALGYEHYSGYLQRMRDYVVTGTGNNYETEFKPLVKSLQSPNPKTRSWVDFFFTSDIHIIGLALDFVEMHLWWLLTYRARLLSKTNNNLSVRNRIYYYYPESVAANIKNKLELMTSSDIIPFSVKMKGGDWRGYYGRVLEKVAAQKKVRG